ncbi:hypothetical protein [Rothia santali]|uniref:hypothetical protein n=1 Tax=Rothia santali TaxID=2949643 RepID=UPI0020B184E7|nr:hypothetical protein [Rothia santali]
MPHKRNPVLSVLIRRSGVSAGAALGTLAQAGALAVEERPDLAWHLEWEPLRSVARHGVIAASLTRELAGGLEVHPEAMRRNLADHGPSGGDPGPARPPRWPGARRGTGGSSAP